MKHKKCSFTRKEIMKKILFLITSLTLLFCLGWRKTVQAEAYYESIELYESHPVDTPFATVLLKGYYIIGTYPYAISRDNFKGNFSYELVQGKQEISLEDFKKTGPLDLPEKIIQEELIDIFNTYFNDTDKVGAMILKVHSSAVFFTDINYSYSLTALSILTEEINSDPTLAGNKHHFTSIDHPISIDELKARYSAEDNVDKTITNRLTLETNYDPEHRRLGSFYVSVKVSDSAGNETAIFDIIEYKDFIPPKINFLDDDAEINIEVNTELSMEDIHKHFLISDNYTPEQDIIKFYTDMDHLKNNLNKLGRYRYKLSARDLDGSCSDAILYINIVDTTKPTISLKGGGDTILTNHVLQEEEILALFEVSDNYYDLSPADLVIVSNTCTGEEGKEYVLTLSLTDGSNNTREETFKYILNDTHSPIIRVEKTLFLPLGKTFSNSELLQMLKEAGIISMDAVDVSFSYDTAIFNSEGVYDIKYTEITKDGKQIEGNVILNIFTPIQIPHKNTTRNYHYLWLLLLIPLISSGIIFYIKFKKHEKI